MMIEKVMIQKSGGMMVEKSDDSMGQQRGGICASAPRPHGKSEDSKAKESKKQLSHDDRRSDDSIRRAF